MEKAKRSERVAALTKLLVDRPRHLYPFSFFCEKFSVAKSTLSEDVATIKAGLELHGLGRVETLAGASGGVRYLPCHSPQEEQAFLQEVAQLLAAPERLLPGGMIYTTDLLCQPATVSRLGELLAARALASLTAPGEEGGAKAKSLLPDCVMTVATTGISLALAVAHSLNVPLVVARHDSNMAEGSTVNINYISGSSKSIRTMALPLRALRPGSRVLIVDDVLKGGGSARAMQQLAAELGAQVLGQAFLLAAALPTEKLVEDYQACFIWHNDRAGQQDSITIVSSPQA